MLLEGEARASYLAHLASSDSTRHDAVAKLLSHDAVADQVIGELQDLAPTSSLPRDVLALVGTQVAHFRIIAPIAAGGMGAVYRAENTLLGRTVALKLPLLTHYGDVAARARFLREGRAAGMLEHPNVCRVYEVGESNEGQLYIAMALYEGETLRQRLDRVPTLSADGAVAIAQQIASGLAAAHAAGVVHRDLKPANIMLATGETVRILDFGLARTVDASQTQASAMMGTVAYMAPELVNGHAADARADLWSLGVVLYEMLAGRRPFVGDHPLAIAHAILHDEPLSVRSVRPDISWRLDALIHQLLTTSQTARPASAIAVVAELNAIAAGERAAFFGRLRIAVTRVLRAKETVITLCVGSVLALTGAYMMTHSAMRAPSAQGVVDSAAPGTADAQALEFYKRAQVYFGREVSDENRRHAEGLYALAIARDSLFAQAHAGLALAIVRRVGGHQNEDPAQLQRVRTEAERALQLQTNVPEAHLALGYYFIAQSELAHAKHEFEMAAEGTPTSAEPVGELALLHRMQGDFPEAQRLYQRAVAIEPSNVRTIEQLAITYQRSREYAKAVPIWDRLIVLEPEKYQYRLARAYIFSCWLGNTDTLEATLRQLPARWNPGGAVTRARVQLSRYRRKPADALAILNQSDAVTMQDNLIYWTLDLMRGRLYADLGDGARARASFAATVAVLEDSLTAHSFDNRVRAALGEADAGSGRAQQAIEHARTLVDSASAMVGYAAASAAILAAAEIYTRVGARDEAIGLLDRLLDRSAGEEVSVPILRLDPTWDPLRSDARFERMLHRKRKSGT